MKGGLMKCNTMRVGFECRFMAKKGCTCGDGACYEVVEACNGCSRCIDISSKIYCSAYPKPNVKWKHGNCNLATHIISKSKSKIKINPLKASKRARG